MKVGDLVKIKGSHAHLVGTIIRPWKTELWWEVLISRGTIIHWPESQMEVISENRQFDGVSCEAS